MPSSLHLNRFPNETSSYREARTQLLDAEINLRRQLEAVAALRRKLPLGGEVPEDYVFDETAPGGSTRQVRLSELFAPGKDTLAIYNFMYGPKMKAACPACTSILDSLDGAAPHITQRINLAVVAKNPLDKILAHARNRGWRNLRLLCSGNNTYGRDYHAQTADGDQEPGVNVFVHSNGKVHHSYYTELRFVAAEPGQDHRAADLIWPLWNVLDLTPQGRGTDWHPRLSYS